MTISSAYGGTWVDSDLQGIRVVDANTLEFGPDSGKAFVFSRVDLTVDSGKPVDVLLQIGSSAASMTIHAAVSGQTLVTLYEAPTFSAAGSLAIIANRDREAALTGTITVTHSPVVTSEGTPIYSQYLPGGACISPIGSVSQDQNSFVLGGNTNYLLRLKNISVGTEVISVGGNIIDEGAA
jgi:hypothetical protein